jgi:hypothetical protein
MVGWEKRAFATDSVNDHPQGGWPITRRETCHALAASVTQSPVKSTQKKVCWAGHSSIHHDGSRETWFKGKTYSFVTYQWTVRCWHECTERCMQSASCSIPSPCTRGAVLFTDECAIYRSVNSRNIVFWAKQNPHFYEELEKNPPHVMVWAGLSATHVWPYLLSRLRYWTGLPWHA